VPIDTSKSTRDGGKVQSVNERVPNPGRSMDLETPPFPHKKESQDVIEVGVGEKNAFDGAVTNVTGLRLKRRRSLDLPGKIGRGVNQKPVVSVTAPEGTTFSARWVPDRNEWVSVKWCSPFVSRVFFQEKT